MSAVVTTPVVRSEREIARLAIDKVSSYTLAFLAAYEAGAAIWSSIPVALWQYLIALTSILLWGIGQFIILRTSHPLSFAPLLIFLMIAPILVGDRATQPWISNGLNCIVAVVYFTGTGNRIFSTLSAIAIAFLQFSVAHAHLPSNTDLADIEYFGSFFSTIWVLLVAFFLIKMRTRYLNICDQIDDELDELRSRMFFRRQYLKKRNLRDYLNLQLHGTVLNSIIVLRNRAQESELPQGVVKETVQRELKELELSSQLKTGNLLEAVETELLPQVALRLHKNIQDFSSAKFEPTLQLQLVEIYREILINIERHTPAQNVDISLKKLSESRYHIIVREDSPQHIQHLNIDDMILNAESSKSIARLIKPLNAHFEVRAIESKWRLERRIEFSTAAIETNPLSELKRLRYGATTTLSDGFLQLSLVYGFAILPGLFIKGAPTRETIIFTFALCFTAWGMYGSRYKQQSAWLGTCAALLILPSLEIQQASCTDIPALAWIFNGMLASVFLISARSENAYVKWIPCSIFLIESISTILTFPKSCNSILAGSTPGIVLIMVGAFLVGRLRNQNLAADSNLSREAENEETNVSATEELTTFARDSLLGDLSRFAETFDENAFTQVQQILALNLSIQKIRAFLICSEFYEYEHSRTLFHWVTERIENGWETKINILGDGKFLVEPSEWADALSSIEELGGQQELTLSVLNTGRMTIQLSLPQEQTEDLKRRFANMGLAISVVQA